MRNVPVKCFTDSIDNVIQSFSGEPVSFGEIKTLEKEFMARDISVIIGVAGDYSGTAYLSMSESTSHTIASLMLGGCSVSETDDMVKSAVGELCNMIMGSASCDLSTNNIKIDITPPTVVVGETVTFCNDMLTLNIPVKSGALGKFDFDFAVKR